MAIGVFSVILTISLLPVTASNTLQEYLQSKENEISRLVSRATGLFRNRCVEDCTTTRNEFSCATNDISATSESSTSFCSTTHGGAVLTSQGCQLCTNRKLNSGFSTVRTPSQEDTCTDNVIVDRCWSRDLDETFKENSDPAVKWQFYASRTGLFRVFPALAQEKCYDFDPRSKFWYVSTTTGPKDVIILLDTSDSMAYVPEYNGNSKSLITTAQEAVYNVLRTMNSVDYVAVVGFSTEAKQITIQSKNTLVQATRENVEELVTAVSNVDLGMHTNFEAGFRLAFDVFDRSVRVGRTASCHKTILFLTDGEPTRGEQNAVKLSKVVQQMNTDSRGKKIATIFTYSIGPFAKKEITKQVACNADGVWTHIEVSETERLQEQLGQYYDYYGTLHKGGSAVMWSAPYMDSFGAVDEVITGAKSVYDNSTTPSTFIGVVGIDLSLQNLTQRFTRDDVLREINSRNRHCPTIEVYDNCEIELLRLKEYNQGVISYKRNYDRICQNSSALTCGLPSMDPCPDSTAYPSMYTSQCQQDSAEKQDFVENSCCTSYNEPCPASSANTSYLSRFSFLGRAFLILLLEIAAVRR
ncbi:voltage-dependent calcium channel subunit alpha-2/delta-1-like [Glandiceps talaboti]